MAATIHEGLKHERKKLSTVMYRHFIAPTRAFSQLAHAIIRHPRLGSDAVRILTWQLSLPPDTRETLSRTAERAHIGGCAFTRAKRQLKAEGYLHERRVQGPGGQWTTQQVVTNEPLSAEEAAKLLARTPVPTRWPESVPSAGIPAVGEPTGRLTDGHPKKDLGEDTSIHPPEPEPGYEPDPGHAPGYEPDPGHGSDPEPEPEPPPRPEPAPRPNPHPDPEVPAEAREFIRSLPALSPALRHIPPGMRNELARLAAAWLAAGHGTSVVREHVRRGLPKDGTPVHRPGGLVRYLLREVPPPAPPESPPAPAERHVSARLLGARECASERHVQPMLFRPVGDETFCALCASHPAPAPAPVPAPA